MGQIASRPWRGSRIKPETKADVAREGTPGRTVMVGRRIEMLCWRRGSKSVREKDLLDSLCSFRPGCPYSPIDESHSIVLGDQVLANEFLGPISTFWKRGSVRFDYVWESYIGRSKSCNGTGEDEANRFAFGSLWMSGLFQKSSGGIDVDSHSQIPVLFRSFAHDSVQTVDSIGNAKLGGE